MTTKTISAAILGVALIAALALFLRHEPPPGANPASKDLSTPPTAETTPTAQPQSPDTNAPHSDTRADSRDPPDAPLPLPSAPAPITEALEDLKLPAVPEMLETERAFAAEAVDPQWSPQAEAHILGEIAQMTGLKLITLRVECKTSLCRLHVAQQELSAANPFLGIVARLGMNPRWVISVVDRNGVPTSLAYLERGSSEPGAKAE